MMRPQFETKSPQLNPRLRQLWSDLNTCIRESGAWIVSQPDINPLRFEAPLDSTLPESLRQAGHQVRAIGTHERLMPSVMVERGGNKTFTSQSVGVGVVNVFELLMVDKPKAEDPRRRVWTAERLRQLGAERRASKPPPQEVIPERPAIPKPEGQRWKQIPPDIKQKIQDELRSGTHSYRIAKMFGIGSRTVSRIKAAMDATEKAEPACRGYPVFP